MTNPNDNNPSGETIQITNAFNQLNFDHCQELANKNDPNGIFWLGYCYEYGIGVEEKNMNEAFINYQKSANMNNHNGLYQVGYCYYLGIGVEKDTSKAFEYYLKSANAGNGKGIFKTAICYKYGVGIEKSFEQFRHWINKDPERIVGPDDEFFDDDLVVYPDLDRDSKYGRCNHCEEYNTNEAWCQTCDPDITIQKWTSGYKDIDDCVKEFQLKTNNYEHIIEWIPFEKLTNIEKIGEGGFGSVFSATWLNGIRKIYNNDGNYERERKKCSTVALKTLSGSKENPLDILKEFKNHVKCLMFGSKLKIYGLTQDTKANKYFMVFQYADNGSLHKFLRMKFRDLTWEIKLKLLLDISFDLQRIHRTGYIHADFHSGNILQDKGISNNIQSYISDLGLSKKDDENNSKGYIYGVIPYVAPEVLSGQKLTRAADIYGFGVIMSEMSTGQRPFDGKPFDESLVMDIVCNGLRPEFASGTPICYIELAMKCMDSDPQKRPSAYDVWDKINKWNKFMDPYDSDDDSDKDEIKMQFLNANERIKELPIIYPKHSDFMYTSKLINTRIITSAIKESQPINDVEVPVDY